MTKDKQITEIANDLNMHCCSLAEQFCGEMSCNACITNWLYYAGYRKASEVAEDIIRMLRAAGINEWRYPIVADIKKKYLEGEE